jgi:hypothetical protein
MSSSPATQPAHPLFFPSLPFLPQGPASWPFSSSPVRPSHFAPPSQPNSALLSPSPPHRQAVGSIPDLEPDSASTPSPATARGRLRPCGTPGPHIEVSPWPNLRRRPRALDPSSSRNRRPPLANPSRASRPPPDLSHPTPSAPRRSSVAASRRRSFASG